MMNWGVLDRVSGRQEQAMEKFSDAEDLLFGQYIRKIGPLEDLEASVKIINLWQNSMETSIELDDYQHASNMVQNALKLSSFWPAHDLGTPPEISDSIGDFLGAIHRLTPERQQQLHAALPAELSELVNELLNGAA